MNDLSPENLAFLQLIGQITQSQAAPKAAQASTEGAK
jgi:hypothetical protein